MPIPIFRIANWYLTGMGNTQIERAQKSGNPLKSLKKERKERAKKMKRSKKTI